ncbi:MAG: PP2C family serine/threonine-protein phosphatase [Bacteroidota bacterium]
MRYVQMTSAAYVRWVLLASVMVSSGICSAQSGPQEKMLSYLDSMIHTISRDSLRQRDNSFMFLLSVRASISSLDSHEVAAKSFQAWRNEIVANWMEAVPPFVNSEEDKQELLAHAILSWAETLVALQQSKAHLDSAAQRELLQQAEIDLLNQRINSLSDTLAHYQRALGLLGGLSILLLGVLSFFLMKNKSKKNLIEVEYLVPPDSESLPNSAASLEDCEDESVAMVEELEKESALALSDVVPPIVPSPRWSIVGASEIGKGHIQQQIPCQDSHFYQSLGDGWAIAVVADGAGSARHSEEGSKAVATEIVPKVFLEELILQENWIENDFWPDEASWNQLAIDQLQLVRDALEEIANKRGYTIKDLACTLILAIASPKGILLAHIGDGRAAYRNEEEEWKALMVPWKGEEANSTIFLSSDIWTHAQTFVQTRIVNERITAFALLSDGCESASFEHSMIDPETHMWRDPNRPFPRFFEPLYLNILEMAKENIPAEDIEAKWQTFIQKGNRTLIEEKDDKTMILAALIDAPTEQQTDTSHEH